MIWIVCTFIPLVLSDRRLFENSDFVNDAFEHVRGSACCTESMNNTPTVSPDECLARCGSVSECRMFVFQPSTGACWLGRESVRKPVPIPRIDRIAGIMDGDELPTTVIASRSDLPDLLSAMVPRSIGIILGVGHGEFVKHLLASDWNGALYLVDPYIHLTSGYNDPANVDDRTHQLIYENLRSELHTLYQYRHVFVRDFSYMFVDTWKEKDMPAPAFVYVDNNNSEKSVLKDLGAWWNVLAPGGVIAGNMYLDDPTLNIGAKRAVDMFFANMPVQVLKTDDPLQPNWIVFKPI